MRFPSGWKLLAVGELRPVDTRQHPDPAATDPLYLAPETASAVLSRAGHVQLRPSTDVWGVALIFLELILPRPLLQEPYARNPNPKPHLNPHPSPSPSPNPNPSLSPDASPNPGQTDDIVSTLQALKLIKYWKGRHMISVSSRVLQEYVTSEQTRSGLQVVRVSLTVTVTVTRTRTRTRTRTLTRWT